MKRGEGKELRQKIYMFWLWAYTWRNPDHIAEMKACQPAKGFAYSVGNFVVIDPSAFVPAGYIVNSLINGSMEYECPGINLKPKAVNNVAYIECSDFPAMVLNVDLRESDEQIVEDFKKALIIARGKQFSDCGYKINSNLLDWVAPRFGSTNADVRGSGIKRAAGLWIWEYMNGSKEKVTISRAVEEFSNAFDPDELGLGRVNDAYLGFYYRKTKDCILRKEVLPFTKRKKGTNSAE